jgi:uncharacterized repeat protein (TIGR01451 family)
LGEPGALPVPAPINLPPAAGSPTPAPVVPVEPGRTMPAAPAGAPLAPGTLPATPTATPLTPAGPAATPTPAATPATGTPAAGGPAGAAGEGAFEGPGQSNDNPTGRQEPAVSLEWLGPPAAKLGQPADYSLVVRNVCNIAVQKVIVQVRLGPGMTAAATEPKAEVSDNVLMWEVGTLLPKQEKAMQVRLVCAGKGDVPCQAWVTFTGSSAMRVRVREPKLLLKATAPEKVMVGDAATFVLTVSNPGDHPAELVKVQCELSEGLEHARGNKVAFDLGNLAPGETRSVQVICATKAGGEQTCVAAAEADGGLKANDKATVSVHMPRLDLEVAGPKLRYLDRKATYTFKVTNPGDAMANNVTIADVVPAGFKFLSADNGGRFDFSTRTASWFIGEIGPGQSREVKMELLAINPGEHQHKVMAQASRGLKVENELNTRVEGLSAILVEVVDVEDPVEVGADTTYEIRVTNTGSKTETDVKLTCTIPPSMQFKAAQGPTRFQQVGNEIVFDPLAKLAPRADAIYRVTAKVTAKGVSIFKTRTVTANVTEGVTKEEATTGYDD